jgi:hypothetical protein
MHAVLKKLQYKEQDTVLVMNMPSEYAAVLRGVGARIDRAPRGKHGFLQLFVRTEAARARDLKTAIGAIEGDGPFWICYPKGTSPAMRSGKSSTRTGLREWPWSQSTPTGVLFGCERPHA